MEGERRQCGRHASGVRWTESDVARGGPGGDADELCARFDGSSQCTIVMPEKCLGYGLVVPFPAYGFALWFRIMKTRKRLSDFSFSPCPFGAEIIYPGLPA
eukprot:scaffold103639_cov67-Phaeocystis_antarctica.AAC.1